MTEIEALERDIEICSQLIKEHEELYKALNSKAGKLIIKSLEEGQQSAASLTINSNTDLQKQGILGVQAVEWVKQHFEYKRQIAEHSKEQLKSLEAEKVNIYMNNESE